MVNYAISPKWEANKDFKKPFHYVVGKGKIEDDVAETYDGPEQLVQIVRLDMADLLKLGMAEELDFMSKALMSTADKKSGEDSDSDDPAKVLQQAIQKAANFSKMEVMINRVTQKGIVNPKVYLPPDHENARQKGLFYVDAIPFDDRMELFSVIFETEGLSDFREEQETGVGDVADVPSVQLQTDRSVAELRSEHTEGVLSQ